MLLVKNYNKFHGYVRTKNKITTFIKFNYILRKFLVTQKNKGNWIRDLFIRQNSSAISSPMMPMYTKTYSWLCRTCRIRRTVRISSSKSTEQLLRCRQTTRPWIYENPHRPLSVHSAQQVPFPVCEKRLSRDVTSTPSHIFYYRRKQYYNTI